MPDENHQLYRDQARDENHSRSRHTRAAEDAHSESEAQDSVRTADVLAGFSLLADPSTISGATPKRGGDDRDLEVERLRSALHSRSREIETLRKKWKVVPALSEKATGAVLADEPTPAPTPRDGLLDASSARRLAADARKRERASREALEATQRAIATAVESIPAAADETARPSQAGWQRRSLVSTMPVAIPKPAAIGEHDADDLSRLLRAARAEIREFEATLAIARDTTMGQKREIAGLRALRVEKDEQIEALSASLRDAESFAADRLGEPREDHRPALDAAENEIQRLRERLATGEREMEARDAERILLQQKLTERESLIAARSVQLNELRDRFEAQDRALHAARHEYELERDRHSKSLRVLAQLRAALGDGEAEIARVPEPPAEPVHELERPETTPMRSAASACATDSDTETSSWTPLATQRPTIVATPEKMNAYPPIFESWQDDQIRRYFGPMGIDTFADLLRAPLARRARAQSDEQAIVLIGRGAWRAAGRLADGLIHNGSGAFRIHVADRNGPESVGHAAIAHDSPLRDFMSPLAFPENPAALDASLESIRPSALVSRDFLSRENEVDDWLACFGRASERGSCLVFSEATGVDPVAPPQEVVAIGERIWALMPERYTRVRSSNRSVGSWLEAFDASEPRIANHLAARLREVFRLEMFTQFGFLAEPFLASAIGSNFDAEATRDRRFLHQVADLDDRKIEAGVAPALHLVALVDRLAED